MLSIKLLGSSSFQVRNQVVRAELGVSGRLFASYLFQFAGRTHRRERLADFFWGELEPHRSRSALNTAIWRVRKLLEFAADGGGLRLVTIGEQVMLEPAAFLDIDTRRLEVATREAEKKCLRGELSSEDDDALADVVDSYAGPFLEGHDADWITHERERLHCIFVGAALIVMRAAARNRQYDRALRYARMILTAEPLRESVQNDLMVLLVLNAQRADAVRSYHNLCRALRLELDIDPMPDTCKLYDNIVSGAVFAHLDALAESRFGPQAHYRLEK